MFLLEPYGSSLLSHLTTLTLCLAIHTCFRLVSSIGDTYGTALLFHMLVSTITLTLLAYQATKVTLTIFIINSQYENRAW